MLRHILPIIVLVAGARIPHYRHSPRAPVERHLRDGSPVFEPVCLLQQSPQRLENPDPSLPAWNVTKKIVVYNALSTTTEIVPGNFGQEAGSVTAQFPVEFRKEKPPRNLSITDATALFVGATCEANIDHFLLDEFLPLFSTLNRLHILPPKDTAKYIFYHQDLHSFRRSMGLNGGICHDPTRYESLLNAIGLAAEAQVYWGKYSIWGEVNKAPLPPSMCFSRGVVPRSKPYSPHIALNFVEKELRLSQNLSTRHCGKSQVTVLQRQSTRRILNVDAVVDVFRRMGFERIEVVSFEMLTVLEQLAIVKASIVLVGTFGAGLAWSGILHEKAALVEILWPDLPRKYIYSCPASKTSFEMCSAQSRYGARAGYVFVPSSRTVDNPVMRGRGKISKQKDVHVNCKDLGSLLLQLFPNQTDRNLPENLCSEKGGPAQVG